ncbi:MAG: ankyrin repeat domain-containing protein [Terriglobales bacterium]
MKKWIAIWLTAMIGLTVTAFAQGDYHPGTIYSVNHQHISGGGSDDPFHLYNGTYYGLYGGGVSYQIANCGRFKIGQAVDFRVAGSMLYIRGKKGGDLRCAILSANDPLSQAASDGDLEKVKAVLKDNPGLVFSRQPNTGWTPLHGAADNCHKDVAELLLASGADVNARTTGGETPLHLAAFKGCKDVAELLRQHDGHE